MQRHGPRWGQLGCNGLIVLDASGTVVCAKSAAFMQVRGAAFEEVEALLLTLLAATENGSTPGSTVELTGLKSRPELNGTVGTVVAGPDPETGRFQVKCDQDGETRALKPANLTPTCTTGSEVVVDGLKSKPELNGTRGTISGAADAVTGRWQVKCGHDGETRALKPANVTLAVATGAVVELQGLRSKPELNGTAGTVIAGPDPASGRFQVECGHDGETRLLKPVNLRICPTPSDASHRTAAPLAGYSQGTRSGRQQKRPKRRCGDDAPGGEPCDVTACGGDDDGGGVTPLGAIGSVCVPELDAEHAACAAALGVLEERRSAAALTVVLEAYEAHFAHEEAMLDKHLYNGVGGDGRGGTAFSADEGARTSHFADHTRLLRELRELLRDAVAAEAAAAAGAAAAADAAADTAADTAADAVADAEGAAGSTGNVVPAAAVERVLRDFEQHAGRYDDAYAERLAAKLGLPGRGQGGSGSKVDATACGSGG